MMIHKTSSPIRSTLAFLAFGLSTATAVAVENGAPITPFGVFNFGAGMLPPPSDVATVGVRTAFYRASQLRGNDGRRTPVGAKLSVDSYALAVVKMTDVQLLGGSYGFAAVLPFLDMSLDLSVPTPVGVLPLSGRARAQGDMTVTPLIVKWTPRPGLFTHARLDLQLPTGSYRPDRLINAGVNHWTASPAFAFTYIHPSGFEASSSIQLNMHGRNKDTDYRSGIEYQHEFAVGKHVGPWTFGLGGYFYQQITNDRASGSTVPDNKARVRAIGPAVRFFDLGSGWPLVWAHVYKEFGARNRSQGTQIAVRAAWTF